MSNSFQMIPLGGAGNNKGFLVRRGPKKYFLKVYAQHAGDKRNRLRNEFRFCEFAWKQGLRSVPKPLAKDEVGRLGIYEFVEGRPLTESDINRRRVTEMATFFVELNKHRASKAAARLAAASEACFSINDHLLLVDERVRRLRRIKPVTPVHRLAIRFVSSKLVPTWAEIKNGVRRGARDEKVSVAAVLPQKLRCLSPSDFGFHNAILTPKNRLRFVDFEYAGWDDPAKGICDFILQPRLPFPKKFSSDFLKPLRRYFQADVTLGARCRLLYPVLALKWSCIALNSFLPERFESGNETSKMLIRRVNKAKNYLKEVRFPVIF